MSFHMMRMKNLSKSSTVLSTLINTCNTHPLSRVVLTSMRLDHNQSAGLLVAQRRRRIQARCAEGGKPGGHYGDHQEEDRYRDEGHGIGWFHFD